MSRSLSEDLREGYRHATGDPPTQSVALLARARDSVSAGSAERDCCLAAVVTAYRCGCRALWAPVLLDLLAPEMIRRLQRLRPEPPAFDEEELRQQLVVEILQAAADIPLPERPAWQKKQILSRANQALRRRLELERRRQHRERSFEVMGEERL